MSSSGKRKIFSCFNCDYAATDNREFHDHIKTCRRCYKCNKCKFSTTDAEAWDEHRRSHTNSINKSNSSNSNSNSNGYDNFRAPFVFKCNQCTFTTSDKVAWDLHKKSHWKPRSFDLNANGTFRFPAHMSPENIAHSFTYDPYVSIKIDGIFHAVKRDDYSSFDPPLPPHWYSIEGELYRPSADVPPILYLFRIQVPADGSLTSSGDPKLKTLSIDEMMKEIKSYFSSRTNSESKSGGGSSSTSWGGGSISIDASSSNANVAKGAIDEKKAARLAKFGGPAKVNNNNNNNNNNNSSSSSSNICCISSSSFSSSSYVSSSNISSSGFSISKNMIPHEVELLEFSANPSTSTPPPLNSSSFFNTIRDDIEASFLWRDRPNPLRREKGLSEVFEFTGQDQINADIMGCRWYPKMYWKLIADDLDVIEGHMDKWNGYIAKLDDLFRNVHSEEFQRLIKHDGLVITPNVPTGKKSLIKIKPKNEMTIDLKLEANRLFYAGGSDRDAPMQDASVLVEVDPTLLQSMEVNRVYRLYPTLNNKFSPREVRELGKHANGISHCFAIQYKLIHYFELGDLVDIYKLPPWYGGEGGGGMATAAPSEDPTKADVFKLYEYTQNIYHRVINELTSPIKSVREANLLDIGCGSGGQYHSDLKDWNGSYVGIDIDFAKLHDIQFKFKDSKSRNIECLPMNIAIPWSERAQNEFFNNRGLWRTYYRSKFAEYLEARTSPSHFTASGGVGGGIDVGGGGSDSISSSHSSSIDGMKFDIVLSIFSSQYSNSTADSWEGYVSEINKRTKSGSSLFLMFMDGDKVDAFSGKCEYLQIPSADRGELLVTASPQGKAEHREPILRSSHVRKSFVESSTDRWEVIEDSIELHQIVGNFTIPKTHYWKSYIDSISWIVLRKT